jgi:hypothetical protein
LGIAIALLHANNKIAHVEWKKYNFYDPQIARKFVQSNNNALWASSLLFVIMNVCRFFGGI